MKRAGDALEKADKKKKKGDGQGEPVAPPPPDPAPRPSGSKLLEMVRDLEADIAAREIDLENKERSWAELQIQVQLTITALPARVTLNVGGTVFQTSKVTLLKHKDTFFTAMLGTEGRWKPDEATGAYFIDRSPVLFAQVLEWLRSACNLDVHKMSGEARAVLRAEFDYYRIPWPAELQAPVLPEWKLRARDVVRSDTTCPSLAVFVGGDKQMPNFYVSEHLTRRAVYKVIAGSHASFGICDCEITEEMLLDVDSEWIRGLRLADVTPGALVEVCIIEDKIDFYVNDTVVGSLTMGGALEEAATHAFVQFDYPGAVQLLLIE